MLGLSRSFILERDRGVLDGLLLSPGCLLTGNLPSSFVLANWFVKRRGSAIGISQFGVTISGTVLVPVASALVESIGWVPFFLLCALLAIPGLALLARFRDWMTRESATPSETASGARSAG